jgi:hypothetical protein
MTVPIEVGDIVKVDTYALRTQGYGVVTNTDDDMVNFRKLVDRHGGLVKTSKAALTVYKSACIVLDSSEIDKMYEAALKRASDIREHLLANRRR